MDVYSLAQTTAFVFGFATSFLAIAGESEEDTHCRRVKDTIKREI